MKGLSALIFTLMLSEILHQGALGNPLEVKIEFLEMEDYEEKEKASQPPFILAIPVKALDMWVRPSWTLQPCQDTSWLPPQEWTQLTPGGSRDKQCAWAQSWSQEQIFLTLSFICVFVLQLYWDIMDIRYISPMSKV